MEGQMNALFCLSNWGQGKCYRLLLRRRSSRRWGYEEPQDMFLLWWSPCHNAALERCWWSLDNSSGRHTIYVNLEACGGTSQEGKHGLIVVCNVPLILQISDYKWCTSIKRQSFHIEKPWMSCYICSFERHPTSFVAVQNKIHWLCLPSRRLDLGSPTLFRSQSGDGGKDITDIVWVIGVYIFAMEFLQSHKRKCPIAPPISKRDLSQ
jgi:hypothetical protein